MNNKVLKNEFFLEKNNWQRKTYPLKLNLDIIQKNKFDSLIFEYKKCINNCIKIITQNIFPKFKKLPPKKWVKKECPLCKAKSKELKYILKDYEIERYGKEYTRVIFKKGIKTKVCNCFLGQASNPHKIMRKFVMPSKNRKIPVKNDFTVYGKLTANKFKAGEGARTSIYDSCLQKAFETIKSQIKINKKIDDRISFFEKGINHKSKFLMGTEEDKNLKKYTKKKIKSFIKRDEKQIEKLKKRKGKDIKYQQNTIRVYDNFYSLIKLKEDYILKFKDYNKGEWINIKFFGETYQKKLAEDFIKSRQCETEIMNKNGDYYLQYIYKKQKNILKPNKTFTAIGIDVGILNTACCVSMDKNLKPFNIKFFNGRPMRRKRRQFNKIRKIWGKRKKLSKIKYSKGKEKNYVKYITHNLTTEIIQDIYDNYKKPVIIMENLKDINYSIKKQKANCKNILKKLKGSSKKYYLELRKLNLEFKKWNFADFQNFIEYKANWLGIPIIYVGAKNTSIKCNKCGYISENNYIDYRQLKFKCEKCKYICNADFNAGVNIAKSFFENIKNITHKHPT